MIDYTLDDANLETRCPLDNGRHTIQPRHSAGRLDTLPEELVDQVLLALNLQTLTALRRVSHRTMSLVDSLRQYRTIVKHCPNVLRAVVSIGADSFSCGTLYETLSTSRCATCERFGSYLYLITCKRVCYFCFNHRLEYFPVSVAKEYERNNLSPLLLKRLPHILSLPGRYTADCKSLWDRTLFFDRQAVLNSKTTTQVLFEGIRQRGRTTGDDPYRYVAIISAPCFSSSGQSADWGFYCTLCRRDWHSATHYGTKFITRNGVLNHIRWHGTKTAASQRGHGPSLLDAVDEWT